MTCNECASFHLKADERMAKMSYGGCKKSMPGCYFAHTRPACEQYTPAAADIVEKRVAFLSEGKK